MTKVESSSPDYTQYFKKKEEYDKVIDFVVDKKQQTNTLTLIKTLPLTENSKLVFTDDTCGVIELKDYALHFAVIPNGDFVYYTKNKKTGKNANYNRAVLDRVIYQHLQKWGAVSLNESYLEFMTKRMSERLSIETPKSKFELSYLTLETNMSINLEYDVLECSSEIHCFMDESSDKNLEVAEEDPIKVGTMYFKIYNSKECSKYDLLDASDASSGDDHALMCNFTDRYEKDIQWGIKFLTLDRIQIDKKYRRIGLGKRAISELKKFCSLLDIDYIVLQPAPIEENIELMSIERQIAIQMLQKYYENQGFKTYLKPSGEPFQVYSFE